MKAENPAKFGSEMLAIRFRSLSGLVVLAAVLAGTMACMGADSDRGDRRDRGGSRSGGAGNSTNAAAVAPAGEASRTNYSAFRVVNERNIFNANRSGRATSRRNEGPQVRVETLTLVGTLQGEKGSVAMFDGSTKELRKVLKPGESMATLRVVEVKPTKVLLENGTNRVEVLVGGRLRREENQAWELVRGAGVAVSAEGSSGGGGGSASEDSGGGGEVSDIVKRLKQQREKDLK